MSLDNSTLITVLMAVYNTSFSLAKRAIDSVLNQDFSHFELIILDDGSNAELSSKLLNYSIIHESKITYVRHKNCGQSQSINRGIKISKGQFIAVIDADDEYKPQHLSRCFKEMAQADLIASFTETVVNTAEDYYVPDRYDHQKNIHVDDCILFATLFGKKEIFEKLSFDSIYSADSDFYDRATKIFKTRKVDLRTYIYYRNIEGSISATLKKQRDALV